MQQIMQTIYGRHSDERALVRFFQFRLTFSELYLNDLLPVLCQRSIEREFFPRLIQLQQLILTQSNEGYLSLCSGTEFDIVSRFQ